MFITTSLFQMIFKVTTVHCEEISYTSIHYMAAWGFLNVKTLGYNEVV